MGLGGRYNTEPPDIARIVAELMKRVADLEAGNRIGGTSIDKGTLNVRSGAMLVGNIVEFGPTAFGTDITQGWTFRRQDGSVVFQLAGANSGDQYWSFFDNHGNIIMSDDGVANVGLATPWINVPWVSSALVIPTDTTTSSTFTALQSTEYVKQHPRLLTYILVRSSDGTTPGEVQIAVSNGGPVVGDVVTITAGFYGLITILGSVAGEYKDVMELEVQARRTGGAGTIGVRVFGSYACQS